jgi:hypothetical protein
LNKNTGQPVSPGGLDINIGADAFNSLPLISLRSLIHLLMIMNLYHYLNDNGLIWWFGVPITLILVMSLYSQFRKRRSTEN